MKKILTAALLGFGILSASSSFAQVQVGFRAGATLGFASKPDFIGSAISSKLGMAPGPVGGVFLDIPMSDAVSFRPEVAYVQRGIAFRQGLDLNIGGVPVPLGAKITYRSQAIEVPLLFKFNLSQGAIRPYVAVGPAVSYAVDGSIRTRLNAFLSTKPISTDVDYGGTITPWDVAAVGALGLTAPVGRGNLFVEGRYTNGFTRQVQVPALNLNVRNRGVAVSVGYSFPLGG